MGLICVAMSRRFTCGASQKKEFKFWVFPPVSLLFVLVIFFRSKHIHTGVDVGELLPCVYSFLWTSPTIVFLIENPVLRFDTPTWNLCWISKLSQTKLRDALPTLPTEPHGLPTNTHCGLAQACRVYSKFFTKSDQFQWMLIRLYLLCPMWISVSSPHCIDFVCNHMM